MSGAKMYLKINTHLKPGIWNLVLPSTGTWLTSISDMVDWSTQDQFIKDSLR